MLLQRTEPAIGNTVWMLDTPRRNLSAFAITTPYNGVPIWTPDGLRVTPVSPGTALSRYSPDFCSMTRAPLSVPSMP